MKSLFAGLSALAVCASILMPARASDDVAVPAQPACFGWLHRDPPPPRPSYYLAQAAPAPCCPQPAPTCCPQTTCAQSYSLQSYYQAVTSYQTQTYYEPVTTYQTSQYYDPVVTIRTSSYYCPNSCQWKTVQVPETSYVLKTKSCPVQGYVAKSTQVPVVTYQKAYYYQPQTVCTQSPPPSPCCQQAVVAQAPVAQAPCCQQPNVAQSPAQPPNVTATPGPVPKFDPPIITTEPPQSKGPSNGSSWTPVHVPSQTPAPVAKAPILSAPLPSGQPAQTVKLDRIVFGADAVVEGELVRGDKTPRPDVKILFVNANQASLRETVTTNHAGRFQVTLASGGWLVYVHSVDGEAQFHSRIEVTDENMGKIVLVNR